MHSLPSNKATVTPRRDARFRVVHSLSWTLGLLTLIVACRSTPMERDSVVLHREPLPARESLETTPRCLDFSLDKRAFFGDLHVHTAYSLDANLRGTRLNPEHAYRFARGERAPVPPFGPSENRQLYIQLNRPLDFAAVTDHAEFLGVIAACENEESDAYGRAGCKLYQNDPDTAFLTMNARLASGTAWRRRPQICGTGGEDLCADGRRALWTDIRTVAEEFYDRSPGCSFTTFVGYEWTKSMSYRGSAANNLHRNVIFRNDRVPSLPLDYFDYPTVNGLHDALRAQCTEAGNGCDALAIPHNSNLSGGLMFNLTAEEGARPVTRESAARRAAMEPLIEVFQHKGASECLPGSLLGDEACGFELLPYDNIGHAVLDRREKVDSVNYIRHALKLGLEIERAIGANPFPFGFVASTDNHLGLTGSADEWNFAGGGGASEMSFGRALPDEPFYGGGGLVGIWAEENSRESLFLAMRRREVFGTSGPRISPRVYVGWDVPDHACALGELNWADMSEGVPMGGEIDAEMMTGRAQAPTLFVQAMADPGTPSHPGAGLERIELVTGRLQPNGEFELEVTELKRVTPADDQDGPLTCEPSRSRTTSICYSGPLPGWDPDNSAFHYIRVLEERTCRWTTRQCVDAGFDCENQQDAMDLACCLPELGLHVPNCTNVDCEESRDTHIECCSNSVVEPMIRERAWTSPIWIKPDATAPM